jgi:hypothetical protein
MIVTLLRSFALVFVTQICTGGAQQIFHFNTRSISAFWTSFYQASLGLDPCDTSRHSKIVVSRQNEVRQFADAIIWDLSRREPIAQSLIEHRVVNGIEQIEE